MAKTLEQNNSGITVTETNIGMQHMWPIQCTSKTLHRICNSADHPVHLISRIRTYKPGHSISYKIVCEHSEDSAQFDQCSCCPLEDVWHFWLPTEVPARTDGTARKRRLICRFAWSTGNLIENAVPWLMCWFFIL